MGLDKKTVAVNFGGIDQKTDPKQVAIGKMLAIFNAVFTKTHQLLKRYGYQVYPKTTQSGTITDGVAVYGYKDQLLVQDSKRLFTYSPENLLWTNNGNTDVENFDFETKAISFNQNTKQYQSTAYDPTTDYQIFSYTEFITGTNTNLYYSIVERSTNTILAEYDMTFYNSNLINVTAQKVIYFGGKFVVFYVDPVNFGLYYIKIDTSSISSLSSPSAPVLVDTLYSNLWLFDFTTIGTSLYICYVKPLFGFNGQIILKKLTNSFVLSSLAGTPYSSSANATSVSVAADNNSNIYILFTTDETVLVIGTGTVNFYLYNENINTLSAKYSSSSIDSYKISAVVDSSNICYCFYESNYYKSIYKRTLTTSGTFSAETSSNVSVTKLSKAFYYNNIIYYICSPVPQTYINNIGVSSVNTDEQGVYLVGQNFIKDSEIVKAKIDSGSVYISDDANTVKNKILSDPYIINENSTNKIIFAYLKKTNIYSKFGAIQFKSGLQSASFYISQNRPEKKTLSQLLNIGCGFLNTYDGEHLTENNFHVSPFITGTPSSVLNNGAIGVGTSIGPLNKLQYVAVYEWVDNQNKKHRSAPSIPFSVEVEPVKNTSTPAITFSGFYQSGWSSIQGGGSYTFNDFVNLVNIGDVLTGTGIPVGTTIVSLVLGPNQNNYWIGLSAVVTSSGTFAVTRPGSNSAVVRNITSTIGSKIATGPTGWLIGQHLYSSTGSAMGIPDGTMIVANPSSGVYILDAFPTSAGTWAMYSPDIFSMNVTVSNLSLTTKENVSIALYRTENNGTIFYRTSSVLNLVYNVIPAPTVTFSDKTSDFELIGNEQLYTTGGEVENIGAPAPEILLIYKNRLINVPKDNRNTFWYSKQVIDGFGVEFSDSFIQQINETGGDITAAGVIDEKLILFKKNKILYILGDGPSPNGLNNDFTSGQLISADVGCTDKDSVVTTSDGLMFQSEKGIYLLDRSLQAQYIGAPVEDYGTQKIISAQILLQKNQIRFALESGLVLCYDTFHKQWSVFQGAGDSLDQIDSETIDDDYYFLNSSGVVKLETNQYSDYRTVVGVQTQTYIPMSFDTSWFSLATIEGYERIYELVMLGNYVTNHTLTVQVYYDFNESYYDTVTISDAIPSGAPDVFTYRVFMPRQKCTSFRFKITEVPVATYFGEGLKISTMTLRVGAKTGTNKIGPASSYGGA